MQTLRSTTTGCIVIDGQPYQLGSLSINYESATGTKLFIRRNDSQEWIVKGEPFGNLSGNGVTFATAQAMRDFVEANFFVKGVNAGGGVIPVYMEDATITGPRTSAQLTAAYPNATQGTTLFAPNSGSGVVFLKTASGSWTSFPAFPV